MLIIGHRGAAGLARENSLEALRAGFNAGADMLEFDVRLTKDKIPVLTHDFHAFRTHRDTSIISRLTLAELNERTKDAPLVTLEDVLKEFFGRIILNIEIKGRNTSTAVVELLNAKFIKKQDDWDNILFSSFRGSELAAIRRLSDHANLALLHAENPFIFIAYHRRLRLTAAGFHRLYLNDFAVEIAKRAGIFVYAYTVNRPQTALMLAHKNIDGVVTDRPDTILHELQKRSR